MKKSWLVILCVLIFGFLVTFSTQGLAQLDDFSINGADSTVFHTTHLYTGPIDVGTRYILQYADGSKYYALTSVPAQFLLFLQQVPDRFTFQRVDGAKFTSLSYPIDLVGDGIPPIISNLSHSMVTGNSARITWLTDEYANSEIWYGISPGNLTNHLLDRFWNTDHLLNLSGLDPCTTYYYVVGSTDRSNNPIMSGIQSFTTSCPLVAFSSATFSVGEAAGTATIIVTLSNSSSSTVTVHYATSDGTAIAPSDYTDTSDTLTIPSGQISGSFTVPIIDDSIDETDETVNLILSSPVNATLGSPSTAILTIIDNDSPPPPNPFSKLGPADGSTDETLTPTLTWEPTSPVTRYEYCYDSTINNACSNWIDNGTSTSVNLPTLSYSTPYEWHVRAYNDAGGPTYSNASSTAFWSFTTMDQPVTGVHFYLPLVVK